MVAIPFHADYNLAEVGKINVYRQPPETTHDGTVNLVRLITQAGNNGKVGTMNFAWLNQTQKLQPHAHPDSLEYYLFLEGKGQMMLGESWIAVEPGDFVTVPLKVLHSVKNEETVPLKFVTLRVIIK